MRCILVAFCCGTSSGSMWLCPRLSSPLALQGCLGLLGGSAGLLDRVLAQTDLVRHPSVHKGRLQEAMGKVGLSCMPFIYPQSFGMVASENSLEASHSQDPQADCG